jgi:protein-arginine kinase activator protein McsA
VKKPWVVVLCSSGTNVLHRGERVWKMMSILVGQEWSELNSGSKKFATLACASCSQTVDEITAAGITCGTCHKILSDDMNISYVTQHSVPSVLM